MNQSWRPSGGLACRRQEAGLRKEKNRCASELAQNLDRWAGPKAGFSSNLLVPAAAGVGKSLEGVTRLMLENLLSEGLLAGVEDEDDKLAAEAFVYTSSPTPGGAWSSL
mmetsp:Transcript_130909/g.227597  ORF Transcript_130909/g.227597 Transcript_130909/m.227597 type:complete len:109 (-) Transcript_130909:651-977(-)